MQYLPLKHSQHFGSEALSPSPWHCTSLSGCHEMEMLGLRRTSEEVKNKKELSGKKDARNILPLRPRNQAIVKGFNVLIIIQQWQKSSPASKGFSTRCCTLIGCSKGLKST